MGEQGRTRKGREVNGREVKKKVGAVKGMDRKGRADKVMEGRIRLWKGR
jgi:hypothetical protein